MKSPRIADLFRWCHALAFNLGAVLNSSTQAVSTIYLCVYRKLLNRMLAINRLRWHINGAGGQSQQPGPLVENEPGLEHRA
jgi:hypothetical protein